jgi:hypothetical protein
MKRYDPPKRRLISWSISPRKHNFTTAAVKTLNPTFYSVRLRPADHSGRAELSSLARTLESWVRIPLEGWMFALFCVCAVVRVGRGLATG